MAIRWCAATHCRASRCCSSASSTDRIIGWDPTASAATLHELWGVLYARDNTWEHEWRNGDFVIWANLALRHGRLTIDGAGERTLRRVAMVLSDSSAQQAWTKVSLAADGKG